MSQDIGVPPVAKHDIIIDTRCDTLTIHLPRIYMDAPAVYVIDPKKISMAEEMSEGAKFSLKCGKNRKMIIVVELEQ